MPGARRPRPKVIGDLSIYPIGEGTSLSRYVRAASKAMQTVRAVRFVPGPMSTAVEAPRLDDILLAVKRGHDALVRMGAQRVAIVLRIDHRLDKPETIEYKVGRIQT